VIKTKRRTMKKVFIFTVIVLLAGRFNYGIKEVGS
jgi:hypothetical protein